jgi:hypothetical protein
VAVLASAAAAEDAVVIRNPQRAANSGALRYSEPKRETTVAAMQDDFASYVVCLVGSGDPEPFAHFLAGSDAAGYARKRINTHGVQRGYVFGVATTTTSAAFAGILRGEAEMVESVRRGQMQAQVEADTKRAWERVRKAGTDAIRQFLGR